MDEIKLISFDIFDTLITRNTATTSAIFYIMQQMLQKEVSQNFNTDFIENFVYIRQNSEKFIRENLRINENKYEITLDDIYQYIQTNHSLTFAQAEYMKKIEIATEEQNIVPIYENINAIKNYKANGYKVILISDMYLPQNIIKNFLLKFDEIFNEVEIYVSCEYNKKKSSGSMYELIRQKYRPKFWLHIGDNIKSDILIPLIKGIKVKLFDKTKLTLFEKFLLKKHNSNYKINILIGCSKVLRLKNKNSTYGFGCSFVAPILYTYIKWVLRQCEGLGIKHIYFVARDGYILKEIADKIIVDNKFITHYFYTSRQACKNIQQNNDISILQTYLKQEVASDESKVAFIDINGSGKTQDYITQVLNTERKCITHNFYLHNITTVKQNDNSIKHAMIPLCDTEDWIEYLCRCPQTQTIGYQFNDDNQVLPILEDGSVANIIEWGFNDYLKGILDFIQMALQVEQNNYISLVELSIFDYMNEYIHEHLDKKTADIIGSIPFETKGAENKFSVVAPNINLFNILYPKYTDYIAVARCDKFLKPIAKIIKTVINPRTYVFINKDKKLAYFKIFNLKINITKIIWR